MDRFEAMRVFCGVIEAGGFAAAADRLGMSTSAVSRYVAQLEAHLNTRLLNRTTRRVSATHEGLAYFERCTQLLADLEETEAGVSGVSGVAGEGRPARGRLRLTAPIALATQRLAPAFAAFAAAHPGITLDLVLSDNVIDFAEEGLDMAIRVGRVGSDNLVARQIGETSLLVAAAPAYLARAGTPQTPEALVGHACFTYSFSSTGNQWQFQGEDGAAVSVRVAGPIHANNGMLLAQMAVAGGGIVHGPCFILGPLLESGALVRLLPDWPIRKLAIHVVYPTRRHLSAKVRAMTTFLGDWFRQAPSANF